MIALCPNPYRDEKLTITEKIRGLLNKNGYETVVCPIFVDAKDFPVPDCISTDELYERREDCTMVVVIGGDGTILAVCRALQGAPIPVLGINLGTKGFMTALEPEDWEMTLQAVKGEYTVTKRMMLDVSLIRDGKEIFSDRAFNDAVLHGYGECIKLTTWCDGSKIHSLNGDGLILATPTGSTGYSMSAGGPIVEPGAANILVTPICPHVMGSRTFVLDPARVVTVQTEKLHGRRAYLSVDGNWSVDLENRDIVSVKRSEQSILMVNIGKKSFYDICYEKLT